MILIALTSVWGVKDSSVDRGYVKGGPKAAGKLVQDNLTMLLAFLLPATFGAVAVTKTTLWVFYETRWLGLRTLHRSDVCRPRNSRSLRSYHQ